MLKRCFIVMMMTLSLQVFAVKPAAAGGVPSDDANMTMQIIRDLGNRFMQIFNKIDEIKSKVDLVYQLRGIGAALQSNFTNLACIQGGSAGRQGSSGTVMIASSTSGSSCGNSGLGEANLPVEQLWNGINADVAELDKLETVLKDDSIVPVAVFDELTNLLVSGEGVAGTSFEEQQYNLRKLREKMSRNATLSSISNVGKIQNDITKHKTTVVGVIDTCANNASEFAPAIACSTQGVGINLLLEMERTKVLANNGMAAGYANLVSAKTNIGR